jgi:N-acetylmuramoyl-L-alanine amidase
MNVFFLALAYALLTCTNTNAASACFILDPGHGGIDNSAYNRKHTVKEKDVNLITALNLKAYLEIHGQKVFLTRSNDQTLGHEERTLLANAWQSQNREECAFVSIHHNMFPGAQGVESFYKNNAKSKKLASNFVEQFSILQNLSNRGAKSSFALPPNSKSKRMLESIQGTSVLLELFFMDKDDFFEKVYSTDNSLQLQPNTNFIEDIAKSLGLSFSR